MNIQVKDKLVSKNNPEIYASVLGIVNDQLHKQTYLEVKWSFEETTMCYCFASKVWKTGFTFLHHDFFIKNE